MTKEEKRIALLGHIIGGLLTHEAYVRLTVKTMAKTAHQYCDAILELEEQREKTPGGKNGEKKEDSKSRRFGAT